MKAEISRAVRTEPELHLVLLDQERLEQRPNFLRAGTGSILVHAVIVLLLIGIAPVLWAAAALSIIFGLACLGLYCARLLARRLGATHPLLAASAGILLILDAALVPYLGWLFAAVAALMGLGLAAMTRFGSPRGWSLEDLRWERETTTPEEA